MSNNFCDVTLTVNGERQKADIEGGNAYYQLWYQPAPDN